MTVNPFFLSQLANVHKARMLMADKKIRHIPVKDADSGKLIGMLNQKAVLANAIKIITKRGLNQLQHVEVRPPVDAKRQHRPDRHATSAL